jgi:RNA polymerase sigma-70 factor (ECF subfamily)
MQHLTMPIPSMAGNLGLEMAAEAPLPRSFVPLSEQVEGVPAWTAALARGEEDAWCQFHATYAPRLLRYLLVLTRGHEEAARDALQQTFIRAVRHMRRFATEPDLWRWLACLSRSAAHDLARRELRHQGLLARWFRENPPDPAPDAAETAWEKAVQAALAALDPAERQLIERKYLEKETVQHIAAALAVTEKAVESRLVRARLSLRARVLSQLSHEAI